ncbi:MAG: hypothetical protein FVQ83_10220 [Chloroflexi bacterium]|nr:hypothetical protein [Chloroflexota bacterium]
MSSLPESNTNYSTGESGKKRSQVGRFTQIVLIILLAANLGFLTYLGWPTILYQLGFTTLEPETSSSEQIAATPTPTLSNQTQDAASTNPTPQTFVITATPLPMQAEHIPGLIVLAINENGYTHLFAYQPETLPLTRLTSGDWDDIHPALSPDGIRVVFSSNRSGQWDLYILDLTDGITSQITNDLAYDGAPSWSPDGLWLTYEKYVDDEQIGSNLEIYVLAIDGTFDPIRITLNGGADFAPAWSTGDGGRKIAFTSNRTGENDIWLADLDLIGEERLTNYTNNPTINQAYSAWSQNGNQLAWAASTNTLPGIYVQSIDQDSMEAIYLGSGNYPEWDPSGSLILSSQEFPYKNYLSAARVADRSLSLPPVELPGRLDGITWGVYALPATLPENLQIIAAETSIASWADELTPDAGSIFGRQLTIELADVEAPYPQLNALAFEPFFALRNRVANETGWDVLSSLENAFVPLTIRLDPGLETDWLYTGRAFTLNPVLLDVSWMIVVREDYAGVTYWRIYLKTRFQDGSQGRPLYTLPWNFSARFSGNPEYYEQGGAPASGIPTGYWVDFTAMASDHGWERQPALSNWRSFYNGARFNEFAITSGLDWKAAMLQLYPPEILETPYPISP